VVDRDWFGGPPNLNNPMGNSVQDPMGTIRRAPDGTMWAICFPERPLNDMWMVFDKHGCTGYQHPMRVAHWPVTGRCAGTTDTPEYRHNTITGTVVQAGNIDGRHDL